MKKFFLLVLLATFSIIGYAQSKVTGKITSSEDGSPIPYASIVIKGTAKGVTSNEIGEYVIESVPKNATLVFSSIGFLNLEIPVNGRAVVDAVLSQDNQVLDEVMVVAYGTVKKGTYTGAASLVKNDAIKDVPTISFENALSGKVAGLQINSTSGQVGSYGQVRVRGTGSINASNEPLYVVDGIPVLQGDVTQLSCVSNNVMSTINPSDIESITVLKDAAASSLYGSRAANGVIMITTKRGKSGKPQISFKANVGFSPSWATDNYEPASYQEQKELMYEMRYNQYINKGLSTDKAATEAQAIVDNTLTNLEDPRGEFDWDKALFRTAMYQNYDLSVSGGTDKTTYYTSLAYTKEEGRSINNDFTRISGRANISQKIGNIFESTTNLSLSRSKKSGFNDTDNGTLNYFQMSRNRLFACYWPYDSEGNLIKTRWNNTPYNILWYDDYWDNSSTVLKISAIETLKVNIIPEILSAQTSFSFDNYQVTDKAWYGPTHFFRSTKGGQIDNNNTTKYKVVSSSVINYSQSFGEHNISALVGFEAERNKTNYSRATGNQFPNDVIRTIYAAGTTESTEYSYGNTMASVLSKIEYNYAGKYFASGSFRRDGSSQLSPDTRWGNFWSVAGSWKINNEKFMKNISWINNLRLRASYGVNGTLPSGNYEWIPTFGYSQKYQGISGGVITGNANADLTWESSYTYNIGLESSFFDNRLNFNLEFFNRDSKDLLLPVQTSRTTGFTSILANVGQIRNRGWEIELNGDIIRNKAFTWNMGLTASFIKGKVIKLNEGADIIWYDPTGGDDRAKYIYREGESTYAFYGNEWAGVERETGKAMWYINPKAGEEYTADAEVNGRPVTYSRNKSNEVIIGSAEPKVYGGINTSFDYKGIALNLGFTYSVGGKTYDYTEVYNADDGLYRVYMMTKYYYDNRWTPEHKDARYPIRVYDAITAKGYQSRKLHSGDYLRLKNATLSYNLPKSLISKIKMQNVRIFATGTNLLTWSAFDLYDPEVNIYGTKGWEMPPVKTYTFGIEITL